MSEPTRDYRVICLSETLSPATHMARSTGNESLIAREPVVTSRGVAYVPCLSGNAIRHRCLRAPGVRWLIDEYGLRGTLTLQQLNFLLHGGNLTEGGAVRTRHGSPTFSGSSRSAGCSAARCLTRSLRARFKCGAARSCARRTARTLPRCSPVTTGFPAVCARPSRS